MVNLQEFRISITGLGSMIDGMKANLFGVMVHPIMPQCIVTGIQENQMIALVKTAWSCIIHAGMTTAAKRSMAISAKDRKVSLDISTFGTIPFTVWRLALPSDYIGW